MRVFILFFCGFLILDCQGQEQLPRRSFLGVRLDTLSKAEKQRHKIPHGVVVAAVVPGSTASKAGVTAGDVLLSVNSNESITPQEVVQLTRRIKIGEPITFALLRSGKKILLKSEMQPFPKEVYTDLEVIYSDVAGPDARLRTIMTRPKKGNTLPAILYIQGIGCGSVENPLDTTATQTQLVNHLARAGYVVLRVEKSGTGDSQGVPCSQLDFFNEMEGYRSGLRQLMDDPRTDRENVFIVGHSLGGIWAPIIAKDANVKGIITYGTMATNYLEYMIESRRTVAKAIGLNAEDANIFVREYAKCYGLYYALNLDLNETLRVCKDCNDELAYTTLRSQQFFNQLYNVNIPELWKAYNGRVLALWGSSDYIAVVSDQQLVADLINESTPGKATFVTVPDADHGMATALSFQQSARNPGPFNEQVSKTIVDWINNKPLSSMPDPRQPAFIEFPKDPDAKQVLLMPGVENAYPRWGSGNSIVFQSNRDGHWQVYKMNADGSHQKNLSNNSFDDNFVSVSNDGKIIGFVSNRDGNEEIYTMNDDGTNVRRLTNSPGRDIHPYFSPDGTKILFNSTRDGGDNFEVYSMDMDGRNQKRLTRTADEETCARISPEGNKMVLLSGLMSAMNDEILVMNPDGSNPVNLTKSAAAEGWPLWSPDGKKIYFASDREGRTFTIFEMDAKGDNVKQLTRVSAPFMDARPEISKDGKKLLFNRQVTERSGKNTIGIFYKELN